MKMTIPAAAFSAIVVAALFLLAPAARGAAGTPSPFVTFSSLLQEMTDREAAAEWPIPAYTLKQASSHDRRKNDPANAEAWHSNTDYGQFIRTEVNEGRREW